MHSFVEFWVFACSKVTAFCTVFFGKFWVVEKAGSFYTESPQGLNTFLSKLFSQFTDLGWAFYTLSTAPTTITTINLYKGDK